MTYPWMPDAEISGIGTYATSQQPITRSYPLTSGCNGPLQMTFEDLIYILVYSISKSIILEQIANLQRLY